METYSTFYPNNLIKYFKNGTIVSVFMRNTSGRIGKVHAVEETLLVLVPFTEKEHKDHQTNITTVFDIIPLSEIVEMAVLKTVE